MSKLYLPKGFDMALFFENTKDYDLYLNHNKYANNLMYHKSIWLLNQDDFLENGLINLKEDKSFSSPLASVFYEYYENIEDVKTMIIERKDEIQCVVSKIDLGVNIPFGKTQQPELWDYADNVDTIEFLLGL